MMFAEIEYPDILLPEELDDYLARGWFRMRQTIFTTNFLHFNQNFYAAIWLRVSLENPVHDKKYLALRKLNKDFQTQIKKTALAGITPQHEALYQAYRLGIAFEVSPSLEELLIGNQPFNRFNTYNVDIYDGDTLVAAGFFDLGQTSAAGITCIYHPAYKKHSLGKYLMYQKIDFCRQLQLEYFYPGYVVPGYSSFDYKLEIGRAALQYLQLSTQQWVPYTQAAPIDNPLAEMMDKLESLKQWLAARGMPSAVRFYKFFEANLDPYYHGSGLFDFPVFLHHPSAGNPNLYELVVFDVRDAKYHLLRCSSVINIGFQQEGYDIFDTDLLRVEGELFSAPGREEAGELLLRKFKNL